MTHHIYSPSTLKRLDVCPASAKYSELPEVETEWSKEGTDLHAQIESAINAKIKGETPETSDERVQAMLDVFAEFRGNSASAVEVEKRLELEHYGVTLTAGTLDVLLHDAPTGGCVVIDWKTGHKQVDGAENNLQTACYALMASQYLCVDTVTVVIYNPTINQQSVTTFTSEDLSAIKSTVVDIIGRAKSDEPKYCATEECQYCKGKQYGLCPEIMKELEVKVIQSGALDSMKSLDVLADDDLDALFQKCKIVEQLQKRVKEQIEKRCYSANDMTCGSYRLKRRAGGREITDIPACYAEVKDVLTESEFLGCCSLSVAQAEKAYSKKQKENGVTKSEKDGKTMFNEVVFGLISEKKPTFVLERKGGE